MENRKFSRTMSFTDDDSAFGSDRAASTTSSTCDSPLNPFGSFRHVGPLPFSMFEDSSSFSSSPLRETSCSRLDSSAENSTHIYMNMLDPSEYEAEIVNSSFFETRTPCDGKDTTLPEDSENPKSDSTTSGMRPLKPSNAAYTLSTPNRRLIAKKLKKLGRCMHGTPTHCEMKFKTLAVF